TLRNPAFWRMRLQNSRTGPRRKDDSGDRTRGCVDRAVVWPMACVKNTQIRIIDTITSIMTGIREKTPGGSLMRRFSILLIAVAGAATAAPAVHAQPDKTVPTYWPQFRGPGGLGVAAEDVKFPLRFGPDKNVLWKTPLPEGHSSPCIWGNHIFLTG